jgi:general secretion pathway protein C
MLHDQKGLKNVLPCAAMETSRNDGVRWILQKRGVNKLDWAHYLHFSFADLQRFFSRRMAILTLMAILLYEATGIFYKTLTLPMLRVSPPPAAEARAPLPVVATREPIQAYHAILERNVFGTTTQTTGDKQQGNTPQQQDISLLFDLRGTVAGEGKYGFAVIEDRKTRKQTLIKPGDLVSGAKVVRIKRNAIDVMIDKQALTLKIEERTEAPIVPPASDKTPSAPVASGGTITVNRSEIEAALSDMGSMLRQAQVQPYFKAGVPEGFIITNIQPGSLYQRMGIVNGDILQGADGRKIQTADDMVSLLNTLKGASGAALSLMRRGKQQTLDYQFR